MSGSGWSEVGQSGDMPFSTYLRKIEATDMWEDPEALWNHNRQALKEVGTQAPLWASDEKRDDNFSWDFLNLRLSGARVSEDPYLKDGEFLDHTFAYRDSRPANVNDPDMRAHVAQQYARRDLIKFQSDADNGIPEHMPAPAQMVQNMRGAWTRAGKQLLIFEDSKTGRTVGGTYPTVLTGGAVMTKTKFDQEFGDPLGVDLPQRRSKTTALSNDTQIGWRSTVDHEFKVSKYGENQSTVLQINPHQLRGDVVKTHEDSVRIDDMLIPMSTAAVIVDLTRKRQTLIGTGEDTSFDESLAMVTRAQQVSADIRKAQMQVRGSQAASAHTKLDAVAKTKPSAKPSRLDHSIAVVDPKFMEHMVSQTRAGLKSSDTHQSGDRKKVVIGVQKPSFDGTGTNKKLNPKSDIIGIMYASHSDGISTEKKVISFKGFKPQRIDMYSKAAFDQANQNILSYERGNKLVKRDQSSMTTQSTHSDGQKFGFEQTQSKQVGKLGSKYMSDKTITDHESDTVNDI